MPLATIAPPTILHGLPILTREESAALGFAEITHPINSESESAILASVARFRNPRRACWVKTGRLTYTLHILRSDISNLSDKGVGYCKA